jgi:hypothetical protein
MVNGISVNGLGEVAMDASQTASNLIGLGKQLLLSRTYQFPYSYALFVMCINADMLLTNYHKLFFCVFCCIIKCDRHTILQVHITVNM